MVLNQELVSNVRIDVGHRPGNRIICGGLVYHVCDGTLVDSQNVLHHTMIVLRLELSKVKFHV